MIKKLPQNLALWSYNKYLILQWLDYDEDEEGVSKKRLNKLNLEYQYISLNDN